MISFKSLTLTNFRSWKSLHLTDMNKMGLTLIQGQNGSGKSSIRQAIEYLLTDTISDGIPLDEIPMNKDTQAVIQGILEKDGKEIEITKVRDNKLPSRNSIELKVDGDSSLTTSSRKETQKNIEMLLGINKDVLTTSMIFSQHAKSFPEAKESERKLILYDALDLHKYNKYLEVANDRTDHIVDNAKTLEENIKFLETQIKELEDEINTLTVKEGFFDQEIEYKIKELQERAIEEVKKIQEIPENIDFSEERTFIDKDISDRKGKLKELNKFLDSLNATLALQEQKLNSVANSTCPILNCVCSLLEDNALSVRETITPIALGLKLEIDAAHALFDIEYEVMEELGNRKKVLLDQELERKNEIRLIEQQNSFSRSELEKIEKEINKLKKIDGNPYTNLILDKRGKLCEKKDLLLNSKTMLSLLEEDQPYYSFWQKGFHKSGIPNMKVEGFLSSLEDSTNNYLSSVSDRMFVEIVAQKELKSGNTKEEISYKVFNPDKAITDFYSYSGGEQQRVKIANILAFSDLLGKMDIMILDEVLELSLDEDGKINVIDMLREKANDLGSIFVITHSDVMKEKLDNILRIRKNDGISEIF